MFMSLVNSLATKGAEKYADNMIKGTNYYYLRPLLIFILVMTERDLLLKQTMPKLWDWNKGV